MWTALSPVRVGGRIHRPGDLVAGLDPSDAAFLVEAGVIASLADFVPGAEPQPARPDAPEPEGASGPIDRTAETSTEDPAEIRAEADPAERLAAGRRPARRKTA